MSISEVTVNGGWRRGLGDRGIEVPARNEKRVGLGAALRQAWLGYRRRLDDELADAGFADHGFPDGRVLRMCSGPAGTTVSEIGRQLGITRQGASKIVASLRDRRYLTISASQTSGREKVVNVGPRGSDFLAARRKAARGIERELGAELGQEGFAALYRLLDALGGGEEILMKDYLRKHTHLSGLRHLED